jgi:guanylate kinase
MLSDISDIAESQTNSESSAKTTQSRGILFVVSSPSGGGKGTLIQRVLKKIPDLSYSVSFTTRAPRSGEVDGREYFFVSQEKFEQMASDNEFLEWANVHGKLYGTSSKQVFAEISEGRDIILEVDVQGAASVRSLVPDSVSVFILPPSFEVLKQRLEARGTDSAEELELRLRNAPVELNDYSAFQYMILNDNMDQAADQLAAIVYAERAKLVRQEAEVRNVVEAFNSKRTVN